jgi:hypothetical protein
MLNQKYFSFVVAEKCLTRLLFVFFPFLFCETGFRKLEHDYTLVTNLLCKTDSPLICYANLPLSASQERGYAALHHLHLLDQFLDFLVLTIYSGVYPPLLRSREGWRATGVTG